MIPSPSIIKTEVIPGSIDRYIAHLAMRWIERRWWVLLIPIAIPIGLGLTINQAWLLVAFMILLLCYPSLLLLLFGQYALRNQARKAVFSYTITATPNGMTISYFRLNDSEATPPPPETIAFDSTIDYSISSKGLTIKWGNTPFDFTFIPHKAFQSRAESALLIEWLLNRQTAA